MGSDVLLCEVNEGVARIVLNRPDALNAISGDLVDRLGETLDSLAEDAKVRVVLLRGEGSSFCAGADLKFILSVLDDAPALNRYIRKVKDNISKLERFPLPVVAATQGYALAGGLEILLACDLVIAAEDAVLGDQHINFGLIPGGGASQRLPRRVGQRKAKEMMLMGSRVSGTEAEALGLVNKAVPAANLLDTAEEWAATLRGKSPNGLRAMKELLNASANVSLDAGLDLEESVFLSYTRLNDLREGLLAFKEKRKPVY